MLEQLIEKFQETYFSHLSKQIEAIFSPEDQENTPFFSFEFKEYFKKLCKDQKIIEYYAFEKMGSLLCLDMYGNHSVLATLPNDEIAFILESQEAESADPQVIECLKNGTHLLCYKQDASTPLPPGYLWKDYLFEAELLNTRHQKFLCSLVPGVFKFNQRDFVSYDRSFESIKLYG